MIDIQTFMLALGVGNLAFALLMAGYLRDATSAPGLRTWMWARLLSGSVQALGWMMPHSGPALTMDLAAFAWVGGAALEVAAYCQFFGFAPTVWRKMLLPAAALALVAVAIAVALGATSQQMTRVMALGIAAFSAGGAAVLLRPRKGASLLQSLIGLNDAVFAIAILAWVIVANGQATTAHARPILGMAYLASYLLMIVNGFGFLLLCKQKDDAHMRRLATIDDLTDTLNRRAFFERAEEAHQQARRLGKPITLMMLDLDHFKQLNDNYGHACGDQALRVFASTAQAILRDRDLLARLGGEEFAVALPGTALDRALVAAERLRNAVSQAELGACASGHRMTVSIGLVLIEPDEALTSALARADHALYAAKTGGRNRVKVGVACTATEVAA